MRHFGYNVSQVFYLFQIVAILIALLSIANIGKSIYELARGDVVPTVDFVSPLILCLSMVCIHSDVIKF